MKMQVKFLYRVFSFVSYKTEEHVAGVGSITQSGKHVLFLDFDNTSFEMVSKEMNELQKRLGLGNYIVLESSEGHFHVVFFELMSVGEITEIQYHFGMINYIANSLKRGSWILRLSKKGKKPEPVMREFMHAETFNVCSYAHWKFFSELYNISDEFTPKNLDKGTKLRMDLYTTVIE